MNFKGPEHKGEYACLASNKVGQASLQFHVDVVLPPALEGAAIRPVEAFEGEAFTFVCPVRGNGFTMFGSTKISWSLNN